MTSDADERLLAPYRLVRRVSAGDDVPWSGLLVRLASGESRVLVDADEFDEDWAGWSAPVEGHVLAPLDVVRRPHGHDLMMPLCVERVADFLARRRSGRVPLSAGETVTLAVSLLRGIARDGALLHGTGEWWLTDAGRPVLAAGASEQDAPVHTSDLLRTLSEGSALVSALLIAAEAISGPRVSIHDVTDAEDALFALAAAEPLVTTFYGPRAARDIVGFDRTAEEVEDRRPDGPRWVDALTRQVDADLADAVSRATTGLWRRMHVRRGPGRKPWLLAAAAAGVVLAGGLLWPTGAGGPATADVAVDRQPDAASPVATPVPSPQPTDPRATGEAGSTDLAAIADGLLTARQTCGGDASCLAEVVVDPAAAFAPGVIDLAVSERETTLLDDFGGMAVLRVDATAGMPAAQLVVIMLRDEQWLLRDVHPAKQP